MGARLLAAFLWLALGVAGPARAAWIEAQSAHFFVDSDASEAQVRLYATRLEMFDSALRAILGVANEPVAPANRVHVYFVPDFAAVRRYCVGCPSGVGGFYNAHVEGTFAIVPRTTGNTGGLGSISSLGILQHEYTHHILLSADDAYYPLWVNEGLAEFFSTAQPLSNGDLRIGAPDNTRAYSLVGHQMGTAELLGADRTKLTNDERAALYAWGWATIHYLELGKKRPAQLDTYLKLLKGGTPSLAAGRQAFGDFDALDRDVASYVHASAFPFVVVPAAELSVGTITVRTLRPGEAAAMPVHLRSTSGVDAKTAPLVVPDARRVAAAYPDDPWVQRVLIEAEFDAKFDAEAEAAADRALALDRTMVDALLYKGRIHVRRAVAAKATDPAVWREARSWFLKAHMIDESSAAALMFYYQSFAAAHEQPPRSAVDALLRAIVLVPRDPHLRSLVVMELLAENDVKSARAALAPLAYSAEAGASNPAKALLELIDSGADAKAVIAAVRKAKLADKDEGAGKGAGG